MDRKAVVKRFYEIVSSGETDGLDEVCSPDLVGHAGAGADLEQLKGSVGAFLGGFPDLRAEATALVEEGDTVATWVLYSGTHEGEFAGVAATQRPMKIAGWDLIRIEEDRIVEISSYCDLFTLMNQIGALPAPTPA